MRVVDSCTVKPHTCFNFIVFLFPNLLLFMQETVYTLNPQLVRLLCCICIDDICHIWFEMYLKSQIRLKKMLFVEMKTMATTGTG